MKYVPEKRKKNTGLFLDDEAFIQNDMIRKRNLFYFLKIILGVGILVVIFFKIGFQDIWVVFRSVNVFIIPIVLVCHILTIMMGALSQWVLIQPLYDIPFFRYLKYYYPAWSYGLYAPGKIGEASIVYFLARKGIAPGHGAAILVVEKIIAFGVVGMLASLGFFLFFSFPTALKFLGIVLAVGIASVIMILSPFGRNLVKKFILRKHQDLFAGFSKTVFGHLEQHKLRVGICILLSFVKWALIAFLIFLIFSLGFEVYIDFYKIFLINAVATISGLIPLTVNGLGIRQGIAIYLYGQISVTGQVVASEQILSLTIQYLLGVFGILMVWKKKEESRKGRPTPDHSQGRGL